MGGGLDWLEALVMETSSAEVTCFCGTSGTKHLVLVPGDVTLVLQNT